MDRGVGLALDKLGNKWAPSTGNWNDHAVTLTTE